MCAFVCVRVYVCGYAYASVYSVYVHVFTKEPREGERERERERERGREREGERESLTETHEWKGPQFSLSLSLSLSLSVCVCVCVCSMKGLYSSLYEEALVDAPLVAALLKRFLQDLPECVLCPAALREGERKRPSSFPWLTDA